MTVSSRVLLILFWVAVAGYLVGLSGFKLLAYHGDPDPARRQQVLQAFSEADLEAGLAYSRAGFVVRFVWPYALVAVLAALAFWAGPQQWHARCVGWAGGRAWLGGLLFIAGFFTTLTVISLPLSAYSTLVIERSFGFTTLTAWSWFGLYLKQAAIGIVMQTGVMAVVFFVFTWFPRGWVIGVPVATTLMGIAIIVLTPLVITPLFYQVEKLPPGPLSAAVETIAAKAGIDVGGIYQIDASRYSKHTNAYFTGIGKQKWIMLYDTLLTQHTVPEAAMIFAHEAGHWRHDHVRIGLALGFVGTLLTTMALWWLWPLLMAVPQFGLGPLSSPHNLPFMWLLSMIAMFYGAPFEAQISQAMERQADAAALELTQDPCTYVAADVRLARDNRGNLLPHPWVVGWFASHPPAIDRIAVGVSEMDRLYDEVLALAVPGQQPQTAADTGAPASTSAGIDLRAALASAPADRLALLQPATATAGAPLRSALDRVLRDRFALPAGRAWPAGDLVWFTVSAKLRTRLDQLASHE